MKKLFMGSFALMTFAVSILLFQISCEKPVVIAQVANTTVAQQSKLIYLNNNAIYTANYDGSAVSKINLTIATNLRIDDLLSISPDRKNIFFTMYDTTLGSGSTATYKANIDGSGITKISNLIMGGAIAY